MDETSAYFGEPVPCGRVLVDTSGTPGVSDDVLRDRHNVAKEGIVVITVVVDVEQGEIVGDPVMQARGFHGPEGVLDQALEHLIDGLGALRREERKDPGRVRHDSQDIVRRLLQKRASSRPLVLATVVEV
jgi:ribonuclease J